MTMSSSIRRPKGVTAFAILGILDALVMAIFLAMIFGTPELYSSLFDAEAQMELGQEYAITKFDENPVAFGIFVIIVDILAIFGLLSANALGRKLVISCAVAGIIFNIITFGIPGLVSNSILLWYMSWNRTKQYFDVTR